ncbi:Copine like protein [Aduncisulcus paluster]|uniref:Copine like protein n=1 Tax=Aduncisulcus paluster TaxID=2918883 RepID=A0ABQ5KGK4_9EUKA|nr:Copine like protein [Aduncisulcus paluster]
MVVEQLKLLLKARNLPGISKDDDVFALVTVKPFANPKSISFTSKSVKGPKPDWGYVSTRIPYDLKSGTELDICLYKATSADFAKDPKSNVFIGQVLFPLANLVVSKGGKLEMALMTEDFEVMKHGTIVLETVRADVKSGVPTFLDFVDCGACEIGLSFAIDFTNPSLHQAKKGIALYETAMQYVSKVLCPYDADGVFQLYGFGASSKEGVHSHCIKMDEARDLDGICDSYQKVTSDPNFVFGSSAKFVEVIRAVGEQSKKNHILNTRSKSQVISSLKRGKAGRKYEILVILTGGACDDMKETIDALVEYSSFPMAVVIVGLGKGPFKKMEMLDADKAGGLTSSRGVKAAIDNVQFVPFGKFMKVLGKLPAEILAEVPDQFLSYWRLSKIEPIPREEIPNPSFNFVGVIIIIAILFLLVAAGFVYFKDPSVFHEFINHE